MLLHKFIVTFTLLLIPSYTAWSAVYVYEAPNGSKVITDIRINKSGYKLIKSYKTNSFRSRAKRAPYQAKTIKSKYDALIVNTALKYGLEPSFIKAVIHIESAFSYQLKTNHFNANLNIEAGVQHMKDLMDRYDNDKRLSLAAYNAGAGAVAKYNGIPPYEETENYVGKVMRLYKLYKKEI